MRTRFRSASTRAAAVVVVVLAMLTVLAGPASSASGVSISPTVVVFPVTQVGEFSYAMTTITNNSRTETETIVDFSPDEGPLWATQAGTCNTVYGWDIPPGHSCTVQWGFHPDTAWRFYARQGSVSFESGKTLTVALWGFSIGVFEWPIVY